MRTLGIDPGLNITGYGLLDDEPGSIKIIEAGFIKTKESESLAKRLAEISSEIGGLIARLNPDVLAVEELYSHYSHPKTAIIMGHARGVLFAKAAEAGIEVYPYASTKVKKSLTGNGRASKAQVQQMIKSTLQLNTIPEPNDVADALAIALCHFNARRGLEVAP